MISDLQLGNMALEAYNPATQPLPSAAMSRSPARSLTEPLFWPGGERFRLNLRDLARDADCIPNIP